MCIRSVYSIYDIYIFTVCLKMLPEPATVTIRAMTFLAGDSDITSFATVLLGGGVHPK